MMMKYFLALLFFLPSQDSDLERTARKIADMISADPKDIEKLFTDAFLREVPADQLARSFKQLHHDHGKVTEVKLLSRDSDASGKFLFLLEKQVQIQVSLGLEAEKPHRVASLWFSPAASSHSSVEGIIAELKKLPGAVSLRYAKLGEKIEPVYDLNPDAPMAIGSIFKLYILGAMVEEKKPWNEVLKLRADLMSLPSGVLHTWPVGSPVTVHTLASKMISISDNTATDHLLHHVGRERAETMLKEMGNEHPDRTTPFLATLEMFKLKSDADLRKKYLAADEKGRRELLAGAVRDLPRAKAGPWAQPLAIDSLEWFASAADLCRAMDWLRRKNDETALQILAINPGLDIPKARFPYAGYKGGSEPGVLNFAWLLRSKDGAWFCLAVGWNNPEKPVDETRFRSLVQSILYLLDPKK